MFHVDQRGRVKYKSDDLSSNWLDVFFNLTKDMTRFLLSDQFQNIELDSNRIPLNINAYVSMLTIFYIDGYALGFEFKIMINSNLWTWNFILDEFICTVLSNLTYYWLS